MINEKAKAGFTYLVEVVKNGVVTDSETVHNIMPVEGIDHMLNVTLAAGSQVPAWYIGLFEADYTPQAGDTMAMFPGTAQEAVAYDTARLPLSLSTITSGQASNAANRAEFNFTAEKTVRGGFISSTSTKGGTVGVLLSAVRFSSAKVVEEGSLLRVTAGIQIISA